LLGFLRDVALKHVEAVAESLDEAGREFGELGDGFAGDSV